MHPFFLILGGLSFPTLIFYIAPFGGDISKNYLSILILCNLMALFGTLFYPLFNSILKRKNKYYKDFDLVYKLKILLAILSLLNLYIYTKIGFKFAVLDISIRSEVYSAAGFMWFLFVAISMASALLLGSVKSYGLKVGFVVKMLAILNILCVFGYGMKGNALQIMLCYFIGSLSLRRPKNESAKKGGFNTVLKLFGTVFFVLLIFWILNSLRAGKAYSLIDSFMLIYFYLIPPFANFGNIVSQSFSGPYFLGGVLEGVYKLFFIKTNPLQQLDLDNLENQTWNVWGVFANFYTSGGLFELYFGCFIIGLYVAFSTSLYRKHNSLFARMNYAQMLILCLMLHNSYYYQSISPIISIFICGFLVSSKKYSSTLS